MKAFLFLLGIVLSFSALAQEKNTANPIAIKLYNQTTININSNRTAFDRNRMLFNPNGVDFQIFHPTIALEIKNKRKDVQEFEITDFDWTKNKTSFAAGAAGKLMQIAIAFRYEYKLMLNKKQTKNWQASVGFAASPFFYYAYFIPEYTNDYPMKQSSFGVAAFVIPGINYKLSSKLFLDVNVPICLGVTSLENYNNVNPSLPFHSQKYSEFNYDAGFSWMSLRLGIGVRI